MLGAGVNSVKMAEMRGGMMDPSLDLSCFAWTVGRTAYNTVKEQYPEGIFIDRLQRVIDNEQVIRIIAMIGALVDYDNIVTSGIIKIIFHEAHLFRSLIYNDPHILSCMQFCRMWIGNATVMEAIAVYFKAKFFSRDSQLSSKAVKTAAKYMWHDMKQKLRHCLSFDVEKTRTNAEIAKEAAFYCNRFQATDDSVDKSLRKLFTVSTKLIIELDWGWQDESVSVPMKNLHTILSGDMMDRILFPILRHRLTAYCLKIENPQLPSQLKANIYSILSLTTVGAIAGLLSFSMSAASLA